MRILVTGSRRWTDRWPIEANLRFLDRMRGGEDYTLVHGGAKGADEIAAEIARELRWAIEEHPADWDRLGKSAGPRRNAEMVAAGAEVCLAFVMPDSVGTLDCIRRARDAGIPVQVFKPGGLRSVST